MELPAGLRPPLINSKRYTEPEGRGGSGGQWVCPPSGTYSSATLSGFDITASNYPAPEWLPKNVTMHVMNAFTPDLPEQLVGAFDIVHIRAILSAVKDSVVEPLLKNLVKMLSMLPTDPHYLYGALFLISWMTAFVHPYLASHAACLRTLTIYVRTTEPGGYLQWDEGNIDTTMARSPRTEVSDKAFIELLALLSRFRKMFKMRTEWLEVLPKTLEAHGMEVTNHDKFEPKRELFKAWTDDLLMVYEEIQWTIPKAADAGPNPTLTRERYEDLFGRVLKEAQEGC